MIICHASTQKKGALSCGDSRRCVSFLLRVPQALKTKFDLEAGRIASHLHADPVVAMHPYPLCELSVADAKASLSFYEFSDERISIHRAPPFMTNSNT
jgi:hypothetical protein